MASKVGKKAILRELKRIADGIPVELLQNLTKKEIIAPTVKSLLNKAMTDKSVTITDEQRERFQTVIDSGVLDREVEVTNFDTEKAIAAYYDAEIALAVKAGRLPKHAPQWDYLKRKGKKYARKQSTRLKELFDDAGGTDKSDELPSEQSEGDDSAGTGASESVSSLRESGDGREEASGVETESGPVSGSATP